MQSPSSKSGRSDASRSAKIARRLRPISSHISTGDTANRLGRRRRMLGRRASERLNRREHRHARRAVQLARRFGIPALLLGLLALSFIQDGYILIGILAVTAFLPVAIQRVEKAFRNRKNKTAKSPVRESPE